MSNPFADRMSKLSNSELLEILERRSDYEEIAVEAAKKELSDRDLSEVEMKSATNELSADQAKQARKGKLPKRFEEKLNDFLKKMQDSINPLTPKSTRTIIKLLAVGLAIPLFLSISSNFYLFQLFLKFYGFSWYPLGILLLSGVQVVGIWGLWHIKKYGWFITCMSLTSAVTGYLFGIFSQVSYLFQKNIKMNNSIGDNGNSDDGLIINFEEQDYGISGLIDTTPLWQWVFAAIALGAVLIFLNSSRIRNNFLIHRRTQQWAMGVGMLMTVIINLVIRF
ncbi:MAG: hypothetical protein IIA45_02295 [Bacteroidetes bacterium]|nr:hypothetical protein [Bacteroidota bacterium]